MIQGGWDAHDPQEAKDQYALILVLKGAINELITNTDIPESQKEQLAETLGCIGLYKHADVHLEKIVKTLEPLVGAGFTFIRTPKKAAVNSGVGGPQTVRLSRSRQIPELNNQMNNSTIENNRESARPMAAVPRRRPITAQPCQSRGQADQ